MLGTGELIVILCVILILFGGKRLPEFARHLGQGIREFKKACNGMMGEEENSSTHCSEQKNKEASVIEIHNEHENERK